jgi:hypothetical protein
VMSNVCVMCSHCCLQAVQALPLKPTWTGHYAPMARWICKTAQEAATQTTSPFRLEYLCLLHQKPPAQPALEDTQHQV